MKGIRSTAAWVLAIWGSEPSALSIGNQGIWGLEQYRELVYIALYIKC